MRGVRIADRKSFSQVLAPLASVSSELYWSLQLQSGPFVTAGQTPEVIAAIRDCNVGANGQLWGRGVLPRFSTLLASDEWGYIVGLRGPEDEALRRAEVLNVLVWPSDLLDGSGSKLIEILFIESDPEHWEVYSPHSQWLDRLRDQLPTLEIDSGDGEWND